MKGQLSDLYRVITGNQSNYGKNIDAMSTYDGK